MNYSVKCSLLAMAIFAYSSIAKAQPSFFNSSGGTSYNAIPLNSATNKAQYIYGPGLFKTAGATGTAAPAGLITKVYFRLGTTVNASANYSNFTISLGQNEGTSTAWTTTTFTTGLTTVFSATSFALTGATATSWYAITLSNPFPYDPSKSLVYELKVSAGTGNTIAEITTGGNQKRSGTNSASTGTVGTGLVNFGIDVFASKNDLAATGIVGLGNTCGNASDPVFVQIRNTGVVDIPSGQNIPIIMAMTGTSSATLNAVFNRAIKAGNSDTIHVGSLNTINITGSVNLKSWVKFGLDSVVVNDTNITIKTFLGPSKPTVDYNFTLFCDSVKFTNATKDVCNRVTAYKWDFDNGKSSSLASPTHSYSSAGTYNVKLIIFFLSGLKDSIIKRVIINSKPQTNFSFTNQCFGTAIDFSNFSFGVASYRWTFGDATFSTTTSPSKTYSAAGSYTVKLVATSPNNCKDSMSKSVTVFSKPIAAFSVLNACAGSVANISNSSTGGANFSWDLGDGTSSNFYNPGKTYSTAGPYGISLTVVSSQGCSDNTSRSITIFALPVSNFNVQNNCIGVATPFSSTAIGANTYLWVFGDGGTSSSSTPAKTYTKTGTFSASLTVTSINGCNHSLTKPVSIFPRPQANFSSKDACIGSAIDFVNLSSMPSGGGDYIWRYGDGNTGSLANPTYKYAASGPYDVQLVAVSSAGCRDSVQSRISIFDNPKASFTALDVCDGQSVKFINTSSGGTIQSWEFGDGSKNNAFSPSHTYPGPNIYKVALKITSSNNCTDLFEGNVTVKANPELLFFTSDHCLGTNVSFTNLSSGAALFTWKFGDGDSSKVVQASHTYKTQGNYSVKLRGISAKGCMVEQTKPITVFPRPVASFTAPVVCHGLTTQFANASTGATNYTWNFGDGGGSSTASNPGYQYLNSGNYKVILTAISSNNCTEVSTSTISVAALPIPIFIAQDICTGLELKPVNASQGAIISQKWNFGDGSKDTTQSPKHIYTAPGIYKIQLIVNTGLGCSDSTIKTILVYTKPIIKVSNSSSVSKGFSTQLFASGGTDYLWSPAITLDNPISPTPTATPTADTRYSVLVSNAFGCSDTASVNVLLLEDFAIIPNNLITPNENGQNDKWKIQGIEFYPLAKVMVFDQWGRIIISEENYKNTWDGTMNGKPLPDGSYFYVITLPGTDRQYKGILNILRN